MIWLQIKVLVFCLRKRNKKVRFRNKILIVIYIWVFNPIRPDLPSLNPGDHAPRPPLPTSRLGRRLLRRVQWNPFHLSKWNIQNWKRHEARLSDQWFSSKALLHLPCQTQKFPKWLVLPFTSETCRKSSDSLSPPKNANKSRHYSWSNIPNWRLPQEPRNSPTWLGRQSWIISHFIGYCIIECKKEWYITTLGQKPQQQMASAINVFTHSRIRCDIEMMMTDDISTEIWWTQNMYEPYDVHFLL